MKKLSIIFLFISIFTSIKAFSQTETDAQIELKIMQSKAAEEQYFSRRASIQAIKDSTIAINGNPMGMNVAPSSTAPAKVATSPVKTTAAQNSIQFPKNTEQPIILIPVVTESKQKEIFASTP